MLYQFSSCRSVCWKENPFGSWYCKISLQITEYAHMKAQNDVKIKKHYMRYVSYRCTKHSIMVVPQQENKYARNQQHMYIIWGIHIKVHDIGC